jgi:hypothetical protein
MKRTHKDIQEKKYRKLLKTHSNRHRQDNDPVLYKKDGLKRYWQVSTKFKKHPLYKALKEILPLVTDDVQYQETRYHPSDWSSDGPNFKGIYTKDYKVLDPMKQMCFSKEQNVPDEKSPWCITTWEKKQGLIYNEKYFLREELKELLYLKVEPNYSRVWWSGYHNNSEFKREENFIVNHRIRQKGSKTLGISIDKDYWDREPEEKDKELVKAYKKEVEDVW